MAKTKAEATREAERAKALMKIGRWDIHIWENIEWCWCLISDTGYLRIYPDHVGRFFATLADGPGGAGTPAIWHVDRSFEDPNDAVAAQLQELIKHLNLVTKVLKATCKIFGHDC